ncbi:hypothetical protein H7X68_00085 [Candidatus Saccharibacteria bacterium]|nr:hypothetical protein [Candidatus Saccharibacteria bacterium]
MLRVIMPGVRNQSFAIKRPLANESINSVDTITSRSHDVKLLKRPTRTLRLSLVTEGRIYDTMRRNGILSSDTRYIHDKIFNPVLPTSLESLQLPVIGVDYVGKRIERLGIIALILDDNDRVLETEHNEYVRRINPSGQIVRGDFLPHVSIARVPPELATKALLASVLNFVPESIELLPVTSSNPAFLPDKMKVANGLMRPAFNLKEYQATRELPTSPEDIPDLAMMRTHPVNFLSSLRLLETGTDS